MAPKPEHRASFALLVLIAATALVVAGCARRAPAGDVSIASATTPERPALNQPFVVRVSVRSGDRTAIAGAHVEIVAQMSHPGMAPVVVSAAESEPGLYRGSLTLDMAGTWVLRIAATLANGTRVERTLDVEIAD